MMALHQTPFPTILPPLRPPLLCPQHASPMHSAIKAEFTAVILHEQFHARSSRPRSRRFLPSLRTPERPFHLHVHINLFPSPVSTLSVPPLLHINTGRSASVLGASLKYRSPIFFNAAAYKPLRTRTTTRQRSSHPVFLY